MCECVYEHIISDQTIFFGISQWCYYKKKNFFKLIIFFKPFFTCYLVLFVIYLKFYLYIMCVSVCVSIYLVSKKIKVKFHNGVTTRKKFKN